MRSILLAAILFAAVPCFAANRPNVILVVTDDQGYGDIAAHGNEMIRTPNLDRLHGESVRLTDFHVDPTCSPTRSALDDRPLLDADRRVAHDHGAVNHVTG